MCLLARGRNPLIGSGEEGTFARKTRMDITLARARMRISTENHEVSSKTRFFHF